MKDFDIKRFSRTMAWNLKASRKEYLTNTIAMFFVFLFILCISIIDNSYGPTEIRLHGLYSAVQVCSFIIPVCLTICGSWIFNNMKTKQQRIMFKMLPASYLEKFLVRYIYVLILWNIGFLVSFCLADLVRILICEIAGIEWCQSGIPIFFESFSDFGITFNTSMNNVDYGLPGLTVVTYLYSLWIHSTYVLGGVFFRQKQCIFTALLHVVCGIVFLWIVGQFINGMPKSNVALALEEWSIPLSLILIALTVLCYWLSFRIFKRMQVINNKWVNV